MKQKMIDFLLNNAGPSIVLRVKREILKDITEKEEKELQDQILNEKIMRLITEKQQENGWIGLGFHGASKNAGQFDNQETATKYMGEKGLQGTCVLNRAMDAFITVIKYRTLKELCDHTAENVLEEAYQELLAFPDTQKRILQLKQQNQNNIHGAKSDCFENSLAMATDYGLTAQSHSFDSLFDIQSIIAYYESLVSENIRNNHFRVTMYPFFLRAGYREKELIDFMINRVETIHLFITNKDYNIYDDSDKHKSMPKNYRDRPVIKQELYQNYNFSLPLIYDIIGFKELYHIGNESIRSKICSIIEYIATEEYHNFVPFYGIAKIPTGYIAMGWDCMLPYFGGNAPTSNSLFLQRMDLFSNFPPIINTNWFQKGIQALNNHTTKDNTYLLPEDFLIEQDKCWLLGNHMKLGEKKKNESARELESTFWVLRIKRNAELCKQQ